MAKVTRGEYEPKLLAQGGTSRVFLFGGESWRLVARKITNKLKIRMILNSKSTQVLVELQRH